mmetsp:Transcript_46283/g.110914  ORF Transcript_46283/g.110914 Transcript_46283/m.110914 type:complete len:345 (-) Transcript_46283:91-1125(-)
MVVVAHHGRHRVRQTEHFCGSSASMRLENRLPIDVHAPALRDLPEAHAAGGGQAQHAPVRRVVRGADRGAGGGLPRADGLAEAARGEVRRLGPLAAAPGVHVHPEGLRAVPVVAEIVAPLRPLREVGVGGQGVSEHEVLSRLLAGGLLVDGVPGDVGALAHGHLPEARGRRARHGECLWAVIAPLRPVAHVLGDRGHTLAMLAVDLPRRSAHPCQVPVVVVVRTEEEAAGRVRGAVHKERDVQHAAEVVRHLPALRLVQVHRAHGAAALAVHPHDVLAHLLAGRLLDGNRRCRRWRSVAHAPPRAERLGNPSCDIVKDFPNVAGVGIHPQSTGIGIGAWNKVAP